MGVQTIRLDVYSNNLFALSLYQNNGYEKSAVLIGERENFI